MTYAEYDRLARVNWSTLKEIRRSPAHYRQRLLEPRADTPAMRLGRCVHLAVLEPELFAATVERWPKKNGKRAGKKWSAFVEEHKGCEILTETEHDLCLDLQRAVRGDREAGRLLSAGKAEQTALWTDDATGLDCKGRIDYVSPVGIVDLKTARDAGPSEFGRAAWRSLYHCQSAFYQDGWAASHGGEMLPVYLIAVEKESPIVAQVYHLNDDILQTGREECAQLLARLAFCRANDLWPAYSEHGEILELSPPTWALGDEDEDVTGLDLVVG